MANWIDSLGISINDTPGKVPTHCTEKQSTSRACTARFNYYIMLPCIIKLSYNLITATANCNKAPKFIMAKALQYKQLSSSLISSTYKPRKPLLRRRTLSTSEKILLIKWTEGRSMALWHDLHLHEPSTDYTDTYPPAEMRRAPLQPNKPLFIYNEKFFTPHSFWRAVSKGFHDENGLRHVFREHFGFLARSPFCLITYLFWTGRHIFSFFRVTSFKGQILNVFHSRIK